MTPAIQELFDMRCHAAADDLMHDGELPFQMIFRSANGELIACVADMPDAPEERDLLVAVLRLMAVAHDADAVCISAEVWIDPDRHDGRRPSESPSRYEALKVSVMYRDDAGLSLVQSVRRIIRDAFGKICELGASGEPPTAVRCDESMGRLARILPPHRPSRHERRLAKAAIEMLPRHAGMTSSAGV
ncbi:MAG: hypothetical protein QOJ42_3396 [Acidobacteriaceae bacterium]|nr:hypothetical protein [Acidobacteriaceae bacterium]